MHSNPVETTISDEAVEWFSRLHSGRATEEDRQEFEAWRNQSPLHAEAYADVEKFWSLLDEPARRVFEREEMPRRADRVSHETWAEPENRKREGKSGHTEIVRSAGRRSLASGRRPQVSSLPAPRRMPIRRIWAGFVLAAVLAMLLWLPGALRFWTSDYHTGWGERRKIALDDGSLVSLNTHSALSIEFSPEQRVIKLLEGEAYFQVSHDSDRPFVVVTSHGVAEVTGTAFNVYEQSGRMTVTVSEGRVRVYPEGGESRAVELTAGLEVSGDGREIGPVLRVDVQQKLAWREGLLVFSMQPLAAVVDELNRYLPGKIMVADPRIRERIVSGAFDLTQPQDVLTAIEKTLGLDSLNLPGSLTLLYQPIR